MARQLLGKAVAGPSISCRPRMYWRQEKARGGLWRPPRAIWRSFRSKPPAAELKDRDRYAHSAWPDGDITWAIAMERTVTEICKSCGKLTFSGDPITISVSEYLALRKAADIGRERKNLSTYRAASRSAIARKPDLADFIVDCVATMTVEEVTRACHVKFGPDCTSRSSIFRFVADLRRAGILPHQP